MASGLSRKRSVRSLTGIFESPLDQIHQVLHSITLSKHLGIAFGFCTRVNFRRAILRVDDHAEAWIGQHAAQPANKDEAIANGLKRIGIQPDVDNEQIQFLLLCDVNGFAARFGADDVATSRRELTLKDGSDDLVIIHN